AEPRRGSRRRRWASRLSPSHSRLSVSIPAASGSAALLARLAVRVKCGHRQGLETRLRNRLTTVLTDAVRAAVDTLNRMLDLSQQVVTVCRDRLLLLALEGLAAGIGLVVACAVGVRLLEII